MLSLSRIRSWQLAAAVLLVAGAEQKIQAIGMRLLHQGAEAVARGNAFTATADNPSAVYYNPAGITQLDGQNWEVNAYLIGFDVSYSGAGGVHADTPDRVQEVGQLFFSTSLKASRLFFGLGVYAPFGLSTTWHDGSPLRTHATESRLTYLTVNPVLAWKITDTLSVAAGPTINISQVDLRRGIVAPRDEFQFDGDGVGVGFNVGILWQPSPQHSFGLRFFSATDIEFDGTVEVHSETPFLFPSSTEDASTDLDFPYHVALGYSFRPTPAWNFEINVDWTDWDRINNIVVRKDSGDLTEVFNWESSFNYMAGVTRHFENGVSISAGYIFIENSMPTAFFRPSVSDMDFHVGSLGVRYETERWRVGLTYQYGYGDRDVKGSALSPIGASADGDYRFRSHAIALSVGGQF